MHTIDLIQKPDGEKLIQLKEIWMDAFNDPEDYVTHCLSRLPEQVKIITAVEKGKIIGNLYIVPFMIRPGNFPAYYGYAGAVRPECRSGRVYPDIIRFFLDYSRQKNSYCFGASANSYIVKPMALLGFPEIYECLEETLTCQGALEEAEILKRSELSIAEWKNMRPHLEKGQYYMQPCDGWLDYIREEKRYCQEVWEKVYLDNSWHAIIGAYEEDTLFIEESSAPKETMEKNAASLCRTYGVSRIKAHFPVTREKTSLSSVYNCQGTFDKGYLWASLLG